MAAFGWSVGDIIAGVNLAWKVYEAFSDGPRNAGREYAEFRDSFELIKHTLQKLRDVLASLSPEQSEKVTNGFAATEAECTRFVEKHKALANAVYEIPDARNDGGRPMTFTDRCRWVFRTLSWPLERDEARRLKLKLDDYVQAAMLESSARTLEKATEIRDVQVELFQAVKRIEDTMGLLLRLVGVGTSTNIDIDQQFLARFSQQIFAQDALAEFRNTNSAQVLPERASLSADNLLASLEQFAKKMEFLTIRQQPASRSTRKESEAARKMEPPGNIQAVLSVAEWARNLVDAAFQYNGIESPQPARTDSFGRKNLNRLSFARSEPPEEAILRLRIYWDQRKERTNFHFLHSSTETLRPAAPDATQTPLHMTCGVNDSVTVNFFDPTSFDKVPLHDPIQGKLHVSCPWDDKIQSITVTNEKQTLEVVHTIHHANRGEIPSTFIPWLGNSHVEGKHFNMEFAGSHEVLIRKGPWAERFEFSPVYSFTENDFLAFHRFLVSRTLSRQLIYTVDIKRIEISGVRGFGDCSYSKLRVLGSEATGQRSILYFTDMRGFLEWQLDDFMTPKPKDGRDGPRIILKYRPRSLSISGPSSSSERRESGASSLASAESMHPKAVRKMESLTIHFDKEDRALRDECIHHLEQKKVMEWMKDVL